MKNYIYLITCIILLGGAQTVSAESEFPLEDYFFSQNMCYGRLYSPEHGRTHPEQNVVDIAISHFPLKQELLGMDSPVQSYPDTPRFVAKLDVWLADMPEPWQADAFCAPDGKNAQLKCSLECDAGHFFLKSGKNQRLMLIGGTDLDFNDCDAGARVLNREPDDKSFLLDAIPASHCIAR